MKKFLLLIALADLLVLPLAGCQSSAPQGFTVTDDLGQSVQIKGILQPNDIELLGRICGKTSQAGTLVASLQDRIRAVTDKTDKLTAGQRPRAFFLAWYDPLWTAGSHTVINELITKAGGTSIAADLNWQQFAVATPVTLLVTVGLFREAGLAVMAFAWAVMALVAAYLKHQLGGLTGDSYGAINEITVVSVLFLVSMLAFKHWLI